jgi:hypothetical protein
VTSTLRGAIWILVALVGGVGFALLCLALTGDL